MGTAQSHTPLLARPLPEPRWPAVVALVSVGLANLALPTSLVVGPTWLIAVLAVVLLVPALISHHQGYEHAAKWLSYIALSLITVSMVASLSLLVAGLASHKESPSALLLSATLLWVSNILVFASWYWRLDAGGPHMRDKRGAHTGGAFLFPQMTLEPALRKEMCEHNWRPGFVDYLFLAFNTSTAFSPTDVPVLSRWAKGLMMLQAAVSLATLALLAARAVNIL
jgi:hypothetical protein